MSILKTNNTEDIQYFVIHSEPDAITGVCETIFISELEPGSTFESGQSYAEEFNTYEEAEIRAVELGYEIPTPPEDIQEPLDIPVIDSEIISE